MTPTTWRANSAMPALDNAGVTYYNPQVTPSVGPHVRKSTPTSEPHPKMNHLKKYFSKFDEIFGFESRKCY